MRTASAIFGLLAISVISAAGSAPAQAYPVCLRVYGDPTYDECRYTSIPQCNATASGRAAQCFVNPFVASATVVPEGRKHRRSYGPY
jgi:hypothetical protein